MHVNENKQGEQVEQVSAYVNNAVAYKGGAMHPVMAEGPSFVEDESLNDADDIQQGHRGFGAEPGAGKQQIGQIENAIRCHAHDPEPDQLSHRIAADHVRLTQ